MYDVSMGKSFHPKTVNLMFLRNAVKSITETKIITFATNSMEDLIMGR